ncbi:MAG: TfoX/Sxy family protein [Firmicutes bacterium]|nr:TfoX/Sxy family protein [Bacillota bacterium]
MPSTKEYLYFILEQLSGLEEISYRPMMGEYILYYRGKILGGIYDNRLLIKPVKAAKSLLPEAVCEAPYEGAKEMLRVDALEDKDFLRGLFQAMEPEIPAPKPKKKS